MTDTYIELERDFVASPASLYACWSEAEQFAKWYGPEGFSVPACEIDFRVGGKRSICMRSPDGNEMYFSGEIKKIEQDKNLIMTDYMTTSDGSKLDPSKMGIKEWPAELELAISLTQVTDATRLNLRYGPVPAGSMSDQAKKGWEQALNKLASYLQD